jgi:hypothetical protein
VKSEAAKDETVLTLRNKVSANLRTRCNDTYNETHLPFYEMMRDDESDKKNPEDKKNRKDKAETKEDVWQRYCASITKCGKLASTLEVQATAAVLNVRIELVGPPTDIYEPHGDAAAPLLRIAYLPKGKHFMAVVPLVKGYVPQDPGQASGSQQCKKPGLVDFTSDAMRNPEGKKPGLVDLTSPEMSRSEGKKAQLVDLTSAAVSDSEGKRRKIVDLTSAAVSVSEGKRRKIVDLTSPEMSNSEGKKTQVLDLTTSDSPDSSDSARSRAADPGAAVVAFGLAAEETFWRVFYAAADRLF